MELSQLESIYRTYDEELSQANRKASILSGLFGQSFKDDPRNAPCNKAFYESTGNWVKEFAASKPDPRNVLEVCSFLIGAAAKREKAPTYWYTLVAQGYVMELIPLLTQESKAFLAQELDRQYPKRRRLPIQEDLYRMLTAY